jgi:RNA polymerase sigma-70 factor (ECF subfamily)
MQPDAEQAFLAAYDSYSDELFRFVVLRVRDREEALDIVQDTFMRGWDYARNGSVVDQYRGFLYKIARNLIIDRSRKRKAVSLDMMHEESGFDAADQASPEFGQSFDVEQALAVVNQLPAKYRDILIMRYVEDLDIPEIATALGLTANATSVRIHRGVEKLRELVEEPPTT